MQQFTTATEWVDLSNLLERLKRSFTQNPDSITPNKKDLAKRLSQCLTPELSMIHKQTLDVYEEVFKSEIVSLILASYPSKLSFVTLKSQLFYQMR